MTRDEWVNVLTPLVRGLRLELAENAAALVRIAAALERFEPVDTEPEAERPTCPHLPEDRLILGAVQSGWWECGICGHREQDKQETP